jgi:hypothetical protein
MITDIRTRKQRFYISLHAVYPPLPAGSPHLQYAKLTRMTSGMIVYKPFTVFASVAVSLSLFACTPASNVRDVASSKLPPIFRLLTPNASPFKPHGGNISTTR